MPQFHLETLKTTGFMGHDRTLKFSRGLNVVVGPNGAGKTQLVESLRVLVRGTPSIVGAGPDDLMLLARRDPDGYTINGTWWIQGTREDSGPVIRTVRRDPTTNVVSQIISAPRFISNSAGTNAKKAAVAQRLGAWAEAWHPLDWRKGGPELRRTLVSLLGGGTGLRPADFVPPGCPDYMLPMGDAEEIIDVWAEGALERTRTAARVAEAALKAMVSVHAEMADHGGVVPQAQPIRDELTRLHERRARAVTLRDRQRELAADMRTLEGDKAQLATTPNVAALEAKLRGLDAELERYMDDQAAVRASFAATQAENAAIEREEKAASAALAEHHRKGAGRVVWVPGPQTTESVAAATQALQAAEDRLAPIDEEHRRLLDAQTQAGNELIAAERVRVHLESCPNCGFDLRAHQAGEIARLTKARDDAEAAVRAHLPIREEAGRAAARAADAAVLASWQLEEARLADALRAATRPRAKPRTPTVADPRPERARVAVQLDEARRARMRMEALGKRELELATRFAELESAAVDQQPLEEVEAAIERCEAELETALRGLQRLEDFRQAVNKKRAAAEKAEATREWVPRMEAVYTRVMDAIRGAIEEPCSRIGAAQYRLALVDPRGNPDCRLQRNGVDFATLSEGEQALATIAILRALGPTSGAEWRPVFVDRLQAIDALGRQRVAAAAEDALRSGEVDQVFLLGCIDVDEAQAIVDCIDKVPAALINLSAAR